MKFTRACLLLLVGAVVGSCNNQPMSSDVIAENNLFTVTSDSVVQGDFVAKALSRTEIVTNYQSPSDHGVSDIIEFRLSFNSRDNELMPGLSHYVKWGSDTTIVAGVPSAEKPESKGELKKDADWTLKVDLREMKAAFDKNGVWVTATGDSIFRDDFKGVWVAGNVAPMNWDFDNLYSNQTVRLNETDEAGIYELKLKLNPATDAPVDPQGWKIDAVNPDYPQYESNDVLVDALYNMAIDNMVKDIRPDDCFRAGSGWDGVWTRDVSYSVYLALAYLDPERSINSLKAKVKNGVIVQDTGTGGSWPVSSDRVVWAVAAWEIYTVTGDLEWLKYAYEVVKNTIEIDRKVLTDNATHLMHGEQSYLDWREQSYPKWMQPADIFESQCLGTNVLFAKTYEVLAAMCDELNYFTNNEAYKKLEDQYDGYYAELKDAINQQLWNEDKGYYSEYLYGTAYPVQSPGIDNLGQSLAAIWGIADDDRAETLIEKTPNTYFGIPSIYPRLPQIKPYHNDAVWPFVQAFWNLAAASVENEHALRCGLGAMYRAAALFGTHKELFVASNGDFRGTAVNSDRQLWSAAGNVAMVFRVFAGIDFEVDGISFEPLVPACFKGVKTINNFKYRKSLLSIKINGTGHGIEKMTIDGKESADHFFPASLEGEHTIEITMKEGEDGSSKVNMVEMKDMPITAGVVWKGVAGEVCNPQADYQYRLLTNGEIGGNDLSVDAKGYTVASVVSELGGEYGFMSRPQEFLPLGSVQIYQLEKYAPSGSYLLPPSRYDDFVELTTTDNTDITIPVTVAESGAYLIDVRYANGNGPINTDNKCAIRSLIVNTHLQGALVMPQRGREEWLSTGFSNKIQVNLLKGENTIHIKYETPICVNMNGEENMALVDYMRVIKK